MRCRSLYEKNDHYNLIWFKSKGLKFPKAIFININDSNGIKDVRKSIYSNAEFPLKYEDFEIGNIKFSNFEITKEKNIFDSLIKFDISYSEETNLTLYIINDSEKKYSFFEKNFKPEVDFNEQGELENIETNEHIEIPFKKWCCVIKAEDNYSNLQEGTAYDLIQRLSIIKGELWYQINYGLPLLDKIKNKGIFDSVIINIILKHPDVRNIISFNSEVKNSVYKFSITIDTVFNENIEISNTIG